MEILQGIVMLWVWCCHFDKWRQCTPKYENIWYHNIHWISYFFYLYMDMQCNICNRDDKYSFNHPSINLLFVTFFLSSFLSFFYLCSFFPVSFFLSFIFLLSFLFLSYFRSFFFFYFFLISVLFSSFVFLYFLLSFFIFFLFRSFLFICLFFPLFFFFFISFFLNLFLLSLLSFFFLSFFFFFLSFFLSAFLSSFCFLILFCLSIISMGIHLLGYYRLSCPRQFGLRHSESVSPLHTHGINAPICKWNDGAQTIVSGYLHCHITWPSWWEI